MAIGEQSRHELHSRLGAVPGAEAAATLMEHPPPLGWADVATKHDLVLLRRDVDILRSELRAEFHSEMTRQTRTLVFSVIASNLALAAGTLLAVVVR